MSFRYGKGAIGVVSRTGKGSGSCAGFSSRRSSCGAPYGYLRYSGCSVPCGYRDYGAGYTAYQGSKVFGYGDLRRAKFQIARL
jgi:hypothetical protein